MKEKVFAVGDVMIGFPAAVCNHAFAGTILENWQDYLVFRGDKQSCVDAINSEKFGIACVLIDPDTGEILWNHVSRSSGDWLTSPEII